MLIYDKIHFHKKTIIHQIAIMVTGQDGVSVLFRNFVKRTKKYNHYISNSLFT